jgi:hypothetical protein
VSAEKVCGPSGKPAAAQFVVLEPVEVGVQAPRSVAFTQVNEGFHGYSQACEGQKLKLTLLLPRGADKGIRAVPPPRRNVHDFISDKRRVLLVS